MGRPPTAASWTCTRSPGSGPRVLMAPAPQRGHLGFSLSELLCFARRVQSYTSVKQPILPTPAQSLLWATCEVTRPSCWKPADFSDHRLDDKVLGNKGSFWCLAGI